MQKRVQIVDERTGEIAHSRVVPITGAFDEEKGYLFWARKNFSRSFLDIDYPDEMTHDEIGKMDILAKKMIPGANMLGYRGHGGIKAHTPATIAKLLGISERQGYRFVAKMVRLGMLARVERKSEQFHQVEYYVNPIHFHGSNRISLNLYLLFREQLDRVIPKWARDAYARQGADAKGESGQ